MDFNRDAMNLFVVSGEFRIHACLCFSSQPVLGHA